MILECMTCGIPKNISEYHKAKHGKYGVKTSCKSCSCLARREYAKNNREKELAYKEKYRKENPDKIKNYYISNKERILESTIIYQQKNREYYRSKSKEHYENNKPLYRAKDAKYRAKELKANPLHNLSRQDIKELNLELEDFYLIQFYKDCPKGYNVDHIIPLNKGGLHCIYNLQYLEDRLNKSKSDKLPSDWNDPRPINCLPFLSCEIPNAS